MAGRHDDHDDDYMRGMDAAEAFVAGGAPDLDDLDIVDREVTYRRADFGPSFLATRFDSLDRAEFLPEGKAAVQFTTAAHGSSALDDDDALFLPPKFAKSGSVTPAAGDDSSLLPTGDVPDAHPVGYHRVNPSFESEAAPGEIFQTLLDALKKHGVKSTPRADWSVRVRLGVDDGSASVDDQASLLSLSLSLSCPSLQSLFRTLTRRWRRVARSRGTLQIGAFAVVAAEEVYFNVQLLRLPVRSVIRVDFNISSGDEMKFLSTVDKILAGCRSIDKDMKNLPDLSFDMFVDWSDAQDDLFQPSPTATDTSELELLLQVVQNKNCQPSMRYEAAKSVKDLCQYAHTRSAVAGANHQEFIDGLSFMLQDDDEDIVRFAIFAIQNFANDSALAANLVFPGLPETLQHIKAASKKESTKNLAGDLYAIVAPVS
ncbi:hypothetical protein PybrP1_000275 [[Pythium] brassicae (nom. inval.)]|nr:hypothetical protein PybrP1_000275 [[Pythium] brassicae (nom. inval.)]